jgi:hypothetical protein
MQLSVIHLPFNMSPPRYSPADVIFIADIANSAGRAQAPSHSVIRTAQPTASFTDAPPAVKAAR